MNAYQALAAMAQVFTDHPEIWTHGTAARLRGEACPVDAPGPDSFSAQGFLERLKIEGQIDADTHQRASDELNSACRIHYGGPTSYVNDIFGRAGIIGAAHRCTP